MFDIFTEVTGALEEIFFSSLKIFAFSATKDLFFFISNISNKFKSFVYSILQLFLMLLIFYKNLGNLTF